MKGSAAGIDRMYKKGMRHQVFVKICFLTSYL